MSRLTYCVVFALLFVPGPLQNKTFARGFGGGGGFHGGGFGGGGFHGGGFGGGGFDRGGFGGGGGFDRGGSGGGGFDRGGFGGSGGWGGDRGGEGGFGQRQSIGYRGNDAGSFDNGARNTGNWGGDAGRWGGSVNRGQLNNFLGLPTDSGLGAAHNAVNNHGFGSGQAISNYGTHPYSQTWAHSQGNNVHNWAQNHPNWSSWANGSHPWAWMPGGYDAAAWGAAAWTAATWPGVGDWLGWGDTQSYPYDYGQYITYQGDNVYYGSQPAGTAAQYYEEASNVAESAPAPASSAQWLPLGVFGLVKGDGDKPTMTFQLSVDKDGIIRGNAINDDSSTTLPLQGSVQKKTQRVCWTVGTNKTIVYDTGLYNLTKSEAAILVHTGPNKTEQELLVRLKQPSQSGSSNGAVSAN